MIDNIWSKEDDILLDIMMSKKINLEEIAIILNKTLFSIQHRIVILNIYKKYNK